jgi:hypothetical protein
MCSLTIFRFYLSDSLYCTQLVFCGFRYMTAGLSTLLISKHMYLWCEWDSSSDTYHLPTWVLIYGDPRVMSITSCHLCVTKVGSLPLFSTSSFLEIVNFNSDSPHLFVSELPRPRVGRLHPLPWLSVHLNAHRTVPAAPVPLKIVD